MKKTICGLEIVLFVLASVAFSWIIRESNSDGNFNGMRDESGFVHEAREIFIKWFGGNLVSAEEGVYTCVLDKEGSRCQEYPHTTCNSLCSSECLPTSRENTNECRLGTCIDTQEGVCSSNAPKSVCEAQEGSWDSRATSEIPMCRFGCCILGTETQMTTSKRCDLLRDRLGASAIFKPEITNELACIALARPNEEGACVLGESEEIGKFNCKFGTRSECLGLRGTFNQGLLCSNGNLNTTCVKQARTSCVTGKDEVYWFDSCGNRENIYDVNRDRSWNDGKIVAKSASCDLKLGNNLIGRQKTCGNCNYLLGSQCGTPRSGIDSTASIGNFVCRDLSCKDGNQVRKNGESWCVYDSRIGVQSSSDPNKQRAVDTPGSEHYRKVCLNGEITTEVCGSGRNYICSETRDERADFSQAACRVNQWQKCVEISTKYALSASDGKEADEEILNECSRYTDCFLKTVDVDSKFKFKLCVPRYPLGFSNENAIDSDTAQSVCSLGTQTCTYAKKKGFFGSSKTNKNCKEEVFTETMNNLCISLGDCGASANVAGVYTNQGIRTKNAKPLSSGYISDLKKLADSISGQKAEPLSEEEVAGLFGYDVSDPQYTPSKLGDTLGYIGLGATGAIFGLMVHYMGWQAAVDSIGGTGIVWQGSWGPALNGFANVASGVLVGAAVGYFVGKLFGLEGDALLLPIVFGALGGLVAVTGFFGAGSGLFGSVGLFSLGFFAWAGIGALIGVGIVKLLGIGSVKKTKIEFQCLPWQPPTGGGECGKCDADKNKGIPCTQYKCQSLGQACRFINEGTSEEACVNVAANDVTSPLITPNNNALQHGYKYSNVGNLGFRFEGPNNEGCLPTFSNSVIGINTNERAFCKFDNTHTNSFEDMRGAFHSFNGQGSSAKRLNHTLVFAPLSNEANEEQEAIEQEFEEEFDEDLFKPGTDGRVNLYIRCEDINGNTNEAEYNINFCVSPEPDRTPPIITQFIPASPGFAALGLSEKNVRFFTNEPAECKWSEVDGAYDNMLNEATCLNELADGSLFGWACNATLPVTFQENERTFYFRCKDQPWLNITANGTGINGETRNVNQESASYILKKTTNALVIESISPNNVNLFTNGLPIDVNLTVMTRGGSSNGASRCEYKWGQNFVSFFNTGSQTHKQNLRLFEEKNYSIDLRCEDEAGNAASGTSSFNVDVDSEGPQITRVYYSQGLNVITNENSLCAFSLNSCSFSFVNGTLMQGNNLVHTSSFLNNKVYVICKDVFENIGGCVSVGKGVL